MKKLGALLCVLVLLFTITPASAAQEGGAGFVFDLSGMIENEKRRNFVEMMLDHYLRTDEAVRETLRQGHNAIFLFEGCSDNMDDPELSNLEYYRVSAVCIALRMDDNGLPYMTYFNDHCSTLPDRPLDYGAWWLKEAGDVGPATVCDGTYEVYSVRHNGIYEALNLRTDFLSDKIDAVYMSPEGYVKSQADKINIHTRTSNHIIKIGMWSAGCMLVGGGEYSEFTELMECTYYKSYSFFALDRRVGTLTVNRQMLQEEMNILYQDMDAVDMLLANTRRMLPETYLNDCTGSVDYPSPLSRKASKETSLMTLPCSNASDARSRVLAEVGEGEKLKITGAVRNPMGNLWYKAQYNGQEGYIFSLHIMELGWFEKMTDHLQW